MRVRALLIVVPLIAVVASGCGDGKLVASPTASGNTPTPTTPTGVDLSKAAFVDDTKSPKLAVNAIDNLFKDQYVTVKAGTKVTFRNDGRNEHNVLPVVGTEFKGVKTQDFEPGTEYTVTFAEPGDYPYYCSLHGTLTKGMTGAIRVVK